jgi:hypothetical protein
MQDVRRLKGCPVPPMLERALGYAGAHRYVAFYWTPSGDELIYDDGVVSADGDWSGWLTFQHHPLIQPHLRALDLGSSETEAVDWLLLDRRKRELLAGRASRVRQFLEVETRPLAQASKRGEPRETSQSSESPASVPLDVTKLTEILRSLKTAPPPPIPLPEILQERQHVLIELRTWLAHYEPPRSKKPEAVVFSKPTHKRRNPNDDLQKSQQSPGALTARPHRPVGQRQDL